MQALSKASSSAVSHNAVKPAGNACQPRQATALQQHRRIQQVCQASQGAHAAAAAAAAVALALQSSTLVIPQAAAANTPAAELQQQQQQQWQQQQWQQQRQPVFGELAAAEPTPDELEDTNLTEIEDDLVEQVAIPQELTTFMEMLQQGPPKSVEALSAARKAVGFDRTLDGRVMLISDDGEPFQVKTDMGVPGALLLRDAGGYMYYIPSADSDSLVQIDLSDDAIVAQLFANHAWEELLEPLEVLAPMPESVKQRVVQQQGQKQQVPEEHLEQLRLSERDFRTVVSLLRGSEELPEEALGDLDAQEVAGMQQ